LSNSKRNASALAAGGLFLALALTSCSLGDPEASGSKGSINGGPAECTTVSASASHHLPATSPAQVGLEFFAEEVTKQTDGRVAIDVFSDGQLGGIAEMPSNLRSGGVDIALIDGGVLAQFDPELGLLDLPYLFESMEEFNSTMDGPFGESYNERVQTLGISPLYWSAVGPRDMFFVDAKVTSPTDLKGLQMRVPQAPIYISTFEAFGAAATAIPSGDLYTALDTGVVKGFELPLSSTVDLNLNETVSVWAPTGHMMNNVLIAASPSFLNQLCEKDQAAVQTAVDSAKKITREAWASANTDASDTLKKSLTIMKNLDIAEFKNASEAVRTGFTEKNGSELYDSLNQ